MADSKISGLVQVAAFLGTHEYIVNEAGTSKKITGAQIITASAQGTAQFGAAAYAQVTANQGTFTGLTDLTGLAVTVTPGAGRRIKITACCLLSSTVSGDAGGLTIAEGATQLQTAQLYLPSNYALTLIAIAILSPSAVAHTYKLQGQRLAGSGLITMSANATEPAFILVEDIGV